MKREVLFFLLSLLFVGEIHCFPVPFPCAGEACTAPGHDPSAIQLTNDGFYVTLVTGSGNGDAFGIKYIDPSNYSAGWHQGAYSYLKPDWIYDYLYPDGCGDAACPFWAPDIVSNGNGISPGGDDFIMYYSIAVPDVYGKACIGRAEGTFRSGNASSAPSIIFRDSGQPFFTVMKWVNLEASRN